MLLKVGELAARSGLTVRALHHFHQIGLLAPSVRSPAGYRLYNQHDVARLHAIQALRALGVPLKQIGGMLAGDGSDLPAIVARQLRALDNEIAQAAALRQRLALLGEMLAAGREPEMDDWLRTLALMSTYAQYFSADEIRRVVANRSRVARHWPPLVAELQAAHDAGLPPDDVQVQALTQRWMSLMHQWLDGDFSLMERWGQMYAAEPGVRGEHGPGMALIRYVEQAAALRMALWDRYFTREEIAHFKPLAPGAPRALEQAVQRALAKGTPEHSAAARALARRWQALVAQAMGGSPEVAQRFLRACAEAPALRAGMQLSPASLDFLIAAAAHDSGGA